MAWWKCVLGRGVLLWRHLRGPWTHHVVCGGLLQHAVFSLLRTTTAAWLLVPAEKLIRIHNKFRQPAFKTTHLLCICEKSYSASLASLQVDQMRLKQLSFSIYELKSRNYAYSLIDWVVLENTIRSDYNGRAEVCLDEFNAFSSKTPSLTSLLPASMIELQNRMGGGDLCFEAKGRERA